MSFQPGSQLYVATGGINSGNLAFPWQDKRPPNSTDINFPIGKQWQDLLNYEVYVLFGFNPDRTPIWKKTLSSVASIEGTTDEVLANGTAGIPQTGNIKLTLLQRLAPNDPIQFKNLGIGTIPPTTSNIVSSSTQTDNLVLTGTQTEVDTDDSQSAEKIDSVLAPTEGSTESTGSLVQPSFFAPAGKAISNAYGLYVKPVLTSFPGTISNFVSSKFSSGPSSGTIDNNTTMVVEAPQSGTNKMTAFFSPGVGVGATNTTTSGFALVVDGGTKILTGGLAVGAGLVTAGGAIKVAGEATLQSTLSVGTAIASTISTFFSKSVEAYNTWKSGKQVTDSTGDGSGDTAAILVDSELEPADGANDASAISLKPSISAPTGQFINDSYGVNVAPVFTNNQGILNNVTGYYYDGGSAGSGTITSHYSVFIKKPNSGIYRSTAYFDAGVGIGIANSSTGTYALAVSSGINLRAGPLNMPSTSSTDGQIIIDSIVFMSAYGVDNAFFGGAGNFSLTTISAQDNIGIGKNSLKLLTTGSGNCCIGSSSSENITTASNNTIYGFSACQNLDDGNNNVAIGKNSLLFCESGSSNTGVGTGCLTELISGDSNTAVGNGCLFHLTSGDSNIAIGDGAGSSCTSDESRNIFIGSPGVVGDNFFTRIGYTNSGTSSQIKCFIDGIYQQDAGGLAVNCNSNGQLSTAVSSRRFKENIEDMGFDSSKIYDLRPVRFNYIGSEKSDVSYGLIAEEVYETMPYLAYKNEKTGSIDSVRYNELIVFLLNEIINIKKQFLK